MEPLQVFNSWYSQVPPANFVESKVLENQDGCGVKGFNNRIVGGSRIARYFVSTMTSPTTMKSISVLIYGVTKLL